MFQRKDLLGIQDLEREEICAILETAESFKEILTRPIKKVPTLRGKTVVNLFLEPSTRTRISFEIAGKRLSADTISISPSTSSLTKGESLKDMAKTLEALNPDIIVLRHSAPGAPHFLAQLSRVSVINAGDGAHEHPTQALVDLLTIREQRGKIEGLQVAIIGDILHSRVARSDIFALRKLGAKVRLIGPPTLLPPFVEKLDVTVEHHLERGIQDCDIIILLRIQRERQAKVFFPSIREYSRLYGLTLETLKMARKDVLVMHPGPINRGVEIDPRVADSPFSLILDQVTNGVAVRMAILYLILGGEE